MNLPVIKTPRLLLRPLERKDAHAIFNFAKHEEVGVPAGWNPHVSLRDTHEFIDSIMHKRKLGQPGPWMIVYRENNAVIGSVEIHTLNHYKGEIGFVLHPDYWRQGLMSEAVKAAMVVAFEGFKLSRLSYMHFLNNKASEALRASLGFQVEGIKRKGFKHADGRILDEIVSSYTDDDYFFNYDRVFKPFKAQIQIENMRTKSFLNLK